MAIIEIPPITIKTMIITLVGDSSLIVHKWSEKAKKQMLDKQMGAAVQKKAPKDPEQDFRDSLYHHPDGGYGFPTIAFKAAAVSACRFVDNIKMTEARGAFHIDGELIQLRGSSGYAEPVMREDTVKISLTSDLRYRGEFHNWYVTFPVKYNANVFNESQILNLFENAGFGVGVGEWRPEKDGMHGRFHVAKAGELLPGEQVAA